MSATADSSAAPASATAAVAAPSTSVDSARLDQPTDAVAMDSMAQPSQDGDESRQVTFETDGSKETRVADPANTKSTEDSAEPALAASEQVEPKSEDKANDMAASPSSPSKGKDKEETATRPPGLELRQDSVMAIGPAQDEIKAITPGIDDIGPVCNITLLLTSGSRHPYKINAKYLSRRNVAIPEETEDGMPDPFSISIYTLKELILREWRSDWAGKPTSPSSIRLIHFGKLLDDKEPLKSKLRR